MQVESFFIPGPLKITPRVFGDDRGHFFETWNRGAFAKALQRPMEEVPSFAQDNQSSSFRLVLRGLHYQLPPHAQGKLVRCVRGEIFDVAVDIRRTSPTFGRWVGARLSEDNHAQLWVPEGFAHGFLVLSTTAEVLYKTTAFWNRGAERSIRWDDPALAIDWPFSPGDPLPSLSEKDGLAPTLEEASARGEVFP